MLAGTTNSSRSPLPQPGRKYDPAMEWRSHDGIEWLGAELPGARAAFSTRTGGMSRGPFESLNLGILTEDDPADVTANRLLLADALGLEAESVAMGRQVHGTGLAFHRDRP